MTSSAIERRRPGPAESLERQQVSFFAYVRKQPHGAPE
jgi:hypothetical protein